MPHDPRPYQSSAIVRLRENFSKGIRRQLLVAPTGAGKTTIAAIMIDGARRKQKRIWFLAHRKELIDQCSTRLDDHEVDHGVIRSGHPRLKPWLPVQVVSVATVVRGDRLGKLEAPDLIIVDEAHRAMAKTYVEVFDAYPDAAVIGLTATPWRLDGKPLGDRFDELVLVAKPQELIDLGFLLTPRVFAPHIPDLRGVRRVKGDYQRGALADRMNTATLTGDIVKHYLERVAPTPTPCAAAFAVNVAHSEAIRDKFLDAGVAAAHLDAKTPPRERNQILADLKAGTLRVVTNCEILTEGWDLPSLGGVILARPTQSVALALQMMGRGMRPFEGKTGWVLLDHAGCVFEHGFPQDDREYSLEKPAKREKKPRDDEDDPGSVTVCEECFCAYLSKLRECPACGHVREVSRGAIEEVDGTLVELTPEQLRKEELRQFKSTPWNERRNALAHLYVESIERDHKPNWACFKFKDRFVLWPPEKMRKEAWALAVQILQRQATHEELVRYGFAHG